MAGQKVISYQNIYTTVNKETNKVTSQTTTSKIKVDKVHTAEYPDTFSEMIRTL
ncbi:MAG: hypothetical protein NTW78_00005 [Campylobacterales bacterium]|nr:hypothetical protein [Campylobacterales bacterium]